MMTLLRIDTDICGYAISSITHYELAYGAALDGVMPKPVKNVTRFLETAKVIDFDKNAAVSAALVRKSLRSQGKPSGAYDELIAGHALALDAILVTNNFKNFENVPGLKVESWL